jgi:hypothetical protein
MGESEVSQIARLVRAKRATPKPSAKARRSAGKGSMPGRLTNPLASASPNDA